VYTADEVKEKMESLYTTVKAEIQTEFERYAHQSVLFLCLIFLQAEAQGFSVSIDTSSLDDAQLLDALKNFEVGPRLDIANKKLASINGEIDANLVVRVKDLESEKATLLSRVTRMQEQLIAAQKEATDAKDQAESLKKQTEQLNADLLTAAKSNNSDALASELAAARAAVAAAEKKNAETSADLKKRLDEARAELTGKVQATAQYQQVRRCRSFPHFTHVALVSCLTVSPSPSSAAAQDDPGQERAAQGAPHASPCAAGEARPRSPVRAPRAPGGAHRSVVTRLLRSGRGKTRSDIDTVGGLLT